MEEDTSKQISFADKMIRWIKTFIWTDIGVTLARCIFIYVDTHYLTLNLNAVRSTSWYLECIYTIGFSIIVMSFLGLIILIYKRTMSKQ